MPGVSARSSLARPLSSFTDIEDIETDIEDIEDIGDDDSDFEEYSLGSSVRLTCSACPIA